MCNFWTFNWRIEEKFGQKELEMYLHRYNKHHMAYKLYNPITKKIVVNRDIKFLEDKC